MRLIFDLFSINLQISFSDPHSEKIEKGHHILEYVSHEYQWSQYVFFPLRDVYPSGRSSGMARIELKRKRIGHLDVLQVEGSAEGPTVILFHGFGASYEDLAPLAGALQSPKGTNWIFPNGHISVALGPHQEGRAWFPISIADLNRSAETGQPLDWSETVPPGLKRARELAQEMIEVLINKHGTPANKIVLGGFSQGGMLATDVMLSMSVAPAGLAVLSGTLINAADWGERAKLKKGFQFFQSHGVNDQVLSFSMAERLEKLLLAAGWQGQLQRFRGGHEIPPEVLIQLGSYLRARLA